MSYVERPDELRKAIRRTGRVGGRQYGIQKDAALVEHYKAMWRDAAVDMASIPSRDGSEYVGWIIPAEEAAAIFDEAWKAGATGSHPDGRRLSGAD
jgi:hypothetical protein